MADSRLSLSLFHFAVDAAAGFVRFKRFPLVVQLFAAADADLDFDQPARAEINSQRDERQSFLYGATGEFIELPFLDEQLSDPFRLVVPERGLFVFGDVRPNQPEFAIADPGIGFID